MSDEGRYDGKYGDKTKTWANKNSDGTIKQYNVKDVEKGDHTFVDLERGRIGTALGDYRPSRETKEGKSK